MSGLEFATHTRKRAAGIAHACLVVPYPPRALRDSAISELRRGLANRLPVPTIVEWLAARTNENSPADLQMQQTQVLSPFVANAAESVKRAWW